MIFCVNHILQGGKIMNGKTNAVSATRKLTWMSLLCAITVVLVFTPFGMIPLPIVSATTLHIPTIIAAILLGPLEGMAAGFVFGLAALIRAAIAPNSPLDPFFVNPLLSILPRVLIGLTTYYVYKPVSKINGVAGIAAGAVVGSVTNTVGVLGMLYLIYAQKTVEAVGAPFATLVVSIITSSAIAEAVVAAIIATPIVKVVKKTFKI
jgi:uncharacterized membrane protein